MRHAFLKNSEHTKKLQKDDKDTGTDEVTRQKKVGFGGIYFTFNDIFFRTGDEKMSYDASAHFCASG